MALLTSSISTPVVTGDFLSRLDARLRFRAPSALGTAFWAIVTFGVFPLFVWPLRWLIVRDRDTADLSELAAWWRGRVGENDAVKLDVILRYFQPRPMLALLPWLDGLFITSVVGFIAFASQDRSTDKQWLHDLVFLTYRTWGDSRFPINGDPVFWHRAWMWGLLVGAVLLWHGVRSHIKAVETLVDWINQRCHEMGLPVIRNDVARIGVRPWWVLLGLAGACAQIWWLIPLAFTGALQQQYTKTSMQRTRNGLGQQVRAYAVRPMLVAPQADHFCPNVHCHTRLPAVANFCSQCGSPARWEDSPSRLV